MAGRRAGENSSENLPKETKPKVKTNVKSDQGDKPWSLEEHKTKKLGQVKLQNNLCTFTNYFYVIQF